MSILISKFFFVFHFVNENYIMKNKRRRTTKLLTFFFFSFSPTAKKYKKNSVFFLCFMFFFLCFMMWKMFCLFFCVCLCFSCGDVLHIYIEKPLGGMQWSCSSPPSRLKCLWLNWFSIDIIRCTLNVFFLC